MIKMYQVTLIDRENKNKPVSTVVKIEQAEDVDLCGIPQEKKKIRARGVQKICALHYWDASYLKKYNYLVAKVRLYEPEKFKEMKEQKYWEIKKEKFKSGEWKPSKADARKLMLEKIRSSADPNA